VPIDTDARPAVKLLIPLTPNSRHWGPFTRAADALVPFGFLPKRARPTTTYRED
jgi:hypothetical protein